MSRGKHRHSVIVHQSLFRPDKSRILNGIIHIKYPFFKSPSDPISFVNLAKKVSISIHRHSVNGDQSSFHHENPEDLWDSLTPRTQSISSTYLHDHGNLYLRSWGQEEHFLIQLYPHWYSQSTHWLEI